MVKYTLHVRGLPPKKDGANSMWNKDKKGDNQVEKLIELRLEASKKITKTINNNIKIELTVYKGKGDLDNYIAGICDGLMNAGRRSNISKEFEKPKSQLIHPKRHFGFIGNDSKIIKIIATKMHDVKPHYTLIIEGDE